ncbi:CPBP family glutamic-type intramembrane protease [Candidatus Parcubacteria bacterium]|nr:CPBP family intramembrane metalloprotease [Patescibacteria group bacterium]MCG2694129.1 CPBP family glutamic-type intramembrane protease [Candidatus Parcubacteria bacterium]
MEKKMTALWHYLEKEKNGWKKILPFLFFWFIGLQVYLYFVLYSIRIINIKFIGFRMLFVLLCCSIVEEAAFRFTPFYLAHLFFKKRLRQATFIGLIFISGILFGILHPGVRRLWVQGVEGILFGMIYCKLGGIKGKILKPYSICILFHLCVNIFIISLFSLR